MASAVSGSRLNKWGEALRLRQVIPSPPLEGLGTSSGQILSIISFPDPLFSLDITAPASPPPIYLDPDTPPPAGFCPVGEHPGYNYIHGQWECYPDIVIEPPGSTAPSAGGSTERSGGASSGGLSGGSTPSTESKPSGGSTHSTGSKPSGGSRGSASSSSGNDSTIGGSGSRSSRSGSSSPSDSSSPSASSRSGSSNSTKKIVVRVGQEWVECHCDEASRPWFTDELTVSMIRDRGLRGRCVGFAAVSPEMIKACDGQTLIAVDAWAATPAALSASVIWVQGRPVVQVLAGVRPRARGPRRVIVTISGIRRGFAALPPFNRTTVDAWRRNFAFYDQANP